MLNVGEEFLIRVENVVRMPIHMPPWEISLPHERFVVVEEVKFCIEDHNCTNSDWEERNQNQPQLNSDYYNCRFKDCYNFNKGSLNSHR